MHEANLLSFNVFRTLAIAGLCAFATGVAQPAAAASGSVKCGDGKTYTASVPGGSCKTGANWVKCTGSGGDSADVFCNRMPGPCESSGNGGCKSEMKLGDDNGSTVRGGLKLPRGMMSTQPLMKKAD